MGDGVSETPTFAEARQAALDALAAGDPREAFARFRRAVWYPVKLGPEQLADGLAVLAAIFDGLGHGELAAECSRAASDLADADALYDLGYALVEAGLAPMAAVVLGRCVEIAPESEQALTELVSALERSLAYRDAQVLLEARPEYVENSFLCRYLLAYDAAMAGDLATTRRHAPLLAPGDDAQRFMAARIHGILARADRVTGLARLDSADLRGWHYVLTGGLLTHLSPYGLSLIHI